MALSVGLGHREAVADNATCNAPYNRPDGTLIRNPADGAIYLVQSCKKRHFLHPTDITSNYFDYLWVDVDPSEVASLATGDILRGREGTVLEPSPGMRYIVDETGPGQYRKRYIQPQAWTNLFAACGTYPTITGSAYFATYTTTGPDVTATGTRPDGQLIRDTSNGRVYLLEGGQKRWITDPASLSSYNFQQPICNVSNAVANSFPAGNNMRAREGTLIKAAGPETYIIDDTGGGAFTKRHIAGPDGFAYYGFSWDKVRVWSSTDVASYATGPHVHPVKSLFPDRWYQAWPGTTCPSPCSTSWMTLTTYIDYGSAALQNAWSPALDGAISDYNSESFPTTVFFATQSNPNPMWDVHIGVVQRGCYTTRLKNLVTGNEEDRTACTNGYLGLTKFYDESLNDCGAGDCDDVDNWKNRPSRWYYVVIAVNEEAHGQFPPDEQAFQRRATAAHEMGHAIVLRHDSSGSNPETTDGKCGPPPIPMTVMDYDCLDLGVRNYPQPWDACGINHGYFDPRWGWGGC